MSITELLQSAQFVVDATGQRKAVQLDLATWEDLLAWLKVQEVNGDDHSTSLFSFPGKSRPR